MIVMTHPQPLSPPKWLAIGLITVTVLATLILAFASVVANGPRDSRQTVVVFSPSVSAEQALAHVVATGAKPIDAGAWPNVILVDASAAQRSALRGTGVWLVTGSAVLAGCVSTLTNLSNA